MIWWILLAVLVTSVVLWAYFTAQRLNRLHIRTDAALAALQAALDRRVAVAAALLPEVRELACAAEERPLAHGAIEERIARERDLSAALARREGEPPAQLVDAEVRVQLAHRFYNDAVADTRALRLRPLVRALRLGGTAPLPEFFEYRT
ncbi:MAG: hypothetical protein GX859_05425 [Corynebacterium humireducens]|uniref:LemA family protein n=2 Tax=Corynebacterium humireducens TaxID=1223514 RepID=A0A0B5DC50_9CORY|nr:hypothetical protein [Corynebacterium humireducens]AJE33339.1 hypothetical protein B842_07450 [Corynebacterium humireducens NBRC 106098 = DSM 45392]NLA55728.1 hypothetical protein [Corynebacterium humireducens]